MIKNETSILCNRQVSAYKFQNMTLHRIDFNKHMSRLMTKPTKLLCAQRRQISMGICPVWSESLLSAWRKIGSLATHWAHSEDSGQTGRMPRLIWVFAWRTCHYVGFVIMSWGGSMSLPFFVLKGKLFFLSMLLHLNICKNLKLHSRFVVVLLFHGLTSQSTELYHVETVS